MSTCYRFTDSFTKTQVLKAAKKHGITESKTKDSSTTQFCLTDGESYLWAYCDEQGNNVDFCRYGANYGAEDAILAPISEELQTDYLSEHDDEYWEDVEDDEEEE